jgi:peptide deformylase
VTASILKVARIGHPVVRAAAAPVSERELASAGFQHLVDDMIVTMHEYDGVGLAAPQIHVPRRLAVLEVRASDERAEAAVPLTVLVNPMVTPLGEARATGWEGCLSIPGLRGLVPRAESVRLEALDRDGRPYVVEASGFFARVIQHECDHLDGRVYLDRMEDLLSLSYLRELHRYGPDAEDEEEG